MLLQRIGTPSCHCKGIPRRHREGATGSSVLTLRRADQRHEGNRQDDPLGQLAALILVDAQQALAGAVPAGSLRPGDREDQAAAAIRTIPQIGRARWRETWG